MSRARLRRTVSFFFRVARVIGLALVLLLAQPSGTARLQIVTTPPGAVISIDGELAGLAPREEVLRPGVHTIVAELKGALTVSETVSVVDGEARVLRLSLLPEARGPRGAPVAGLITTGLGAAVLTAGLLLRFPAEDAARQMSVLYRRGGGWDDAAAQLELQGLSAQSWSWIFTGAGAAILASGLIVTAVQWFGAPLPPLAVVPVSGGATVVWGAAW